MKRCLSIAIIGLAACGVCAGDFLGTLPEISTVVVGYDDDDSVALRLAAMPLAPAEGVWQMAAGGATFAIERDGSPTDSSPARFRMIMLRSPRRSVRPGTIVGHLQPTAKPGVYEARLYTDFARRTGLSVPRKFRLRLNAERSVLAFEPVKSPLKVNLFRLLPYMYRRAIDWKPAKDEGLRGAVRLSPSTDSKPMTTVYL